MVNPKGEVDQVTPRDIVVPLYLVGIKDMSSRTIPRRLTFEANSIPTLAMLVFVFVLSV